MVVCSVVGCKNSPDNKNMKQNIRYHYFPKDAKLRKQWITLCGNKSKFSVKNSRICSEHFVDSDYRLQDILLNVPNNKRLLKTGSVPSINLPVEIEPSLRAKRQEKRRNKEIVKECLASFESSQNASTSNFTLVNPLKEEYFEEKYQGELVFYTNTITQTEVDPECSKELRIMELEREVRRLKLTIKKKNQQAQKNEALRRSVKEIFTATQIKKMEHGLIKPRWKADDISSSISLYSAGPTAYRLLRNRNFPFPAPSTLRGLAYRTEITPGILNNVIQLMSKWNQEENDRLCVVLFDELKIKTHCEDDKANDIAIVPHKYAMVVMVRGLVKNWRQIVYYDFDTPMTANILKYIISKLEEIYYTVVAVVSDVGLANVTLWSELSISEQQPFISHPSNPMKKIFFFADVPYMIKLLRHHFIDTGFIVNGTIIDTSPVRSILDLEKCDSKIRLKITNKHLELKQSDRQIVKYSAQLFSNSVSSSIRQCLFLGKPMPNNSLECSEFIKVTNDWFDVFNSKCPSNDFTKKIQAFGLALNEQCQIIDAMSESIRNMRTPLRQSLLHFQKGILMSNASLPLLLDYVKHSYSLTYVITNRLSQDDLELKLLLKWFQTSLLHK